MMLQYLDTIIAFVVILLGVSLLITILTQMISALLGYRGTNLRWGLKTLLATLEPGLADKADTLIQKILEKSHISDSLFSRFSNIPMISKLTQRWRLASTLTAEELANCLKNLAETLEKSGEKPEEKQQEDKQTANLIRKVLDGINPEVERKVKLVQTLLDGVGSNYAQQLDKAIQQLEQPIQAAVGKVEAGFDVVMKRASQRFSLQMRIWTIIFAILISFGARLDSVSLFRQLWTDPVLRTNLTGQSEMMLKEASIILGVETGAAQPATPGNAPGILADALERLKIEEKKSTTGLPKAPNFKNMNEAIEWLRTNLKTDKTTRERLLNRYQALVVDELKTHADAIQQGLAKSGFRLQIPTSCKDFKAYYAGLSIGGILGILITSAFLSLGAPFWFNTLKTLSNLRPLAASAKKAVPGTAQS